MSAHTPGPWFTTKVSNYNEVARIGRAWNISTMLPLADFGDVDADARLIAAAPDLLEALKRAKRHLSVYSEEFDMAEQAIAKATGEKQ